MFAWISVFIAVTLIAGLIGLTGGVATATGLAELLLIAFVMASVLAGINAFLRRGDLRAHRSTYPPEANSQAKNKA